MTTVWWEWLQRFVRWAEASAAGQGGLATAEYTYSTTAGVPPSSGQLRGNSLTQNAITAFHLHKTNAVGVDIASALRLLVAGDRIMIQDKTTSANNQYYTVSSAPIDNGTYFTVPVTWTSGGSAFTAGRVMFTVFGLGTGGG